MQTDVGSTPAWVLMIRPSIHISMDLQLDLDTLVATFRRGAAAPGERPTPEHAALCAVIHDLTDAARLAAASDLQRYDHRSLYEFCAALDYITRPSKP